MFVLECFSLTISLLGSHMKITWWHLHKNIFCELYICTAWGGVIDERFLHFSVKDLNWHFYGVVSDVTWGEWDVLYANGEMRDCHRLLLKVLMEYLARHLCSLTRCRGYITLNALNRKNAMCLCLEVSRGFVLSPTVQHLNVWLNFSDVQQKFIKLLTLRIEIRSSGPVMPVLSYSNLTTFFTNE